MKADNVTIRCGAQTYSGTLIMDEPRKRILLGCIAPGVGTKAAAMGRAIAKNPWESVKIVGSIGGTIAGAILTGGRTAPGMNAYKSKKIAENLGAISDSYYDMLSAGLQAELMLDVSNAFSISVTNAEVTFSVPGNRYLVTFETPDEAKAWAEEICRISNT